MSILLCSLLDFFVCNYQSFRKIFNPTWHWTIWIVNSSVGFSKLKLQKQLSGCTHNRKRSGKEGILSC
ncbi:hypothetical protein MKW98_013206, partial [Papaver atlanticum]